MDIRIYEEKIEILEGEQLSKDELMLIMYLIDKGGYWEFRKNVGDCYKVYDKNNFKYKGDTTDEIKHKIDNMILSLRLKGE